MHVLFDESNSLIENDAQDEDFELGLAKKDFLPTHNEGKNHPEGSGTGPVSKEEGQDDKQAGGTAVELYLEQNPETGSRTIRTILQIGAGASSETGERTAPEQWSLENRASETMDSPAPRTWKHSRSHPWIKI